MQNRVWELDFTRGVAILGVVLYHLAYDLLDIYHVNLGHSWEWLYQFAAIFILLSGTSSSFSKNNLNRGVKLSLIAILLTIVTYFYDPHCFIQFGILHLLSVCILFYHFLLHKMGNKTLLVTGLFMIGFGYWLNTITSPWPHMYILGLMQPNYVSMDYFPILPWAGYFLVGIFLARTVYKERRSMLKKEPHWTYPFSFLGRHSLLIYLIHQPILLMLFNLAFFKKLW